MPAASNLMASALMSQLFQQTRQERSGVALTEARRTSGLRSLQPFSTTREPQQVIETTTNSLSLMAVKL